ncbi:MFS transporter [Aquabacterium sp.]|uniref:MFS transporter n=1 Tax=Aquabacterium sp. TaxID=1872578 RepID=UPI002B842D41|nr:MFS transporter [Aquabacterium sp.]HSW03502.1 MFS transporter [Aquabacterium sp.]
MSTATIRTVLPLSLVTATSMLAMDLYLPAVPVLQTQLSIGVTAAQATVAIFLAGLALSQLLWGEALNRLGPRRCLQWGIGALVLASAACALAPGITTLLVMRFVQGIAAGAATVIAPSVVRATLGDAGVVRGIAAISMVEAIVPAAGPVLGALLLQLIDWRGLFWIVAGIALAVLPFVVRVAPMRLPGLDLAARSGWRDILRNRRFVRIALSHALSVGALLMFVASAPQLLANALHLPPSAFAALQVIGVSAFIAMASQSGRIARSLGNGGAVHLGAWIQVGLCSALLIGAVTSALPFAAVAVFWAGFCGALAVRGPPAFGDALTLPSAQLGRASALLVLALLCVGSLGTQGVAPFMAGDSIVPLAAAMLAMQLASIGLVLPYPPRPVA